MVSAEGLMLSHYHESEDHLLGPAALLIKDNICTADQHENQPAPPTWLGMGWARQ